MAVDYVEQTIESGIAPLELLYQSMRIVRTGDLCGLRSVLRINSLSLGALNPSQYRVVSNRNIQCIKLAKWAIENVFEDLADLERRKSDIKMLTVYAPVKLLMKNELYKIISEHRDETPELMKRLCIEFSSDLLYEETGIVAAKLRDLRSLGLKTMLCEYGDDFCPTMRLDGLPFDYVVLDESACDSERLATTAATNMLTLISSLGAEAVCEHGESLRETLMRTSCGLYIESRERSIKEVIDNG